MDVAAGLDPDLVAIGVGLGVGLILLLTGAAVLTILRLHNATQEAAGLHARLATAEADRAAAEAEANAARDERNEAVGVLGDLVEMVDGRSAVWTRQPFAPPADFNRRMADSIPVMALANLKGGVGKTTLAANLAAYFDAAGERVLLIDLDHQGSLSAMALGGDPRGRDFAAPGAHRLLQGEQPRPLAIPGAETASELIDAANVVQADETRILFQWMLGAAGDDVRYRLAAYLLNRRIQTVYDRVIIDTPPRVTLGFVNAVCAATHLLIPTQLNALSVEAVDSFLATLDAMRPAPLPDCQRYRILGVQRTFATARMTRSELEAVARIESTLTARGEARSIFLQDAMLPQMAGFARAAGQGMAYRTEPSVRPEIGRLGAAVAAFAPSWAEEPEE